MASTSARDEDEDEDGDGDGDEYLSVRKVRRGSLRVRRRVVDDGRPRPRRVAAAPLVPRKNPPPCTVHRVERVAFADTTKTEQNRRT